MSASKGNSPGEGRQPPHADQPGPSREVLNYPELAQGEQVLAHNAPGIRVHEELLENREVEPQPDESDDLEESSLEAETLSALDNLNLNIGSSESSVRTSSGDSGWDSKRAFDATTTSDSSLDADAALEADKFFYNPVTSTPK